MRTVHWNSVSI